MSRLSVLRKLRGVPNIPSRDLQKHSDRRAGALWTTEAVRHVIAVGFVITGAEKRLGPA